MVRVFRREKRVRRGKRYAHNVQPTEKERRSNRSERGRERGRVGNTREKNMPFHGKRHKKY